MHYLVSRSVCRKLLADFKKTTLVKRNVKSQETDLIRYLKQKITSCGPITISDYMKEVLTNPAMGYYMNRDVFGTKGDFITSPEISQMFGELIAVWCIREWQRMTGKGPLQIVELGPGRGTLADDVLRVMSKYKNMREEVSLHLVEVSPKLRELQKQCLCSTSNKRNATPSKPNDIEMSKYQIPVYWYYTMQDVPKKSSIFIAHEFFDALPIHKLQKTEKGWREVFLAIDSSTEALHHFNYVISQAPTPASQLYVTKEEKRHHIEVCPDAGVIIQEIAKRISECNGGALIVDYGHDGTKTDTFRGFRKHTLVDPLSEPGTADLTADVDFSFLKRMAGDKVSIYGPINQTEFLTNMAITLRLKMLLSRSKAEDHQALVSGCDMLINPEKMGERFKFLALLPKSVTPKSAVKENLNQLPTGFYNPFLAQPENIQDNN